MQAGNVIGTGTYHAELQDARSATGLSANVTPFWMVGGAGAEVEVDTETGHVRVLKLVNVADAGAPINPRSSRRSFPARAIMQLGFTMFEKMEFDGGQVTNASLADYKIPGIHDVPPMESAAGRGRTDATARSAPRASANPAPSACRRRSPTRSTTRSACG